MNMSMPTLTELALNKVTETLSVPLDNAGVTIEGLDEYDAEGEVAFPANDVTQRVYSITSNGIPLQLIVKTVDTPEETE